MWAQIINTLAGLWLIIAPWLFGYGDVASNNGYITGPVIITFSVVAYWEATRVVRKWNWPLAGWLLVAPWILDYNSNAAIISDMAIGIIVLVFSSIPGKMEKGYGGGWSSLWTEDPEHMREAEKK